MKAYLFTAFIRTKCFCHPVKATSNTSYTEGPVITLKMGEEKSLQKEKLKNKICGRSGRFPLPYECQMCMDW